LRIAVVRVDSLPLGVDTRADLEAARLILKAGRF
jgi:CMP-2-keto-3-deoxyoctulosonic acid synthetase